MAFRDLETLSAFFDGRRVPAQRLLTALSHRGALEFLQYMACFRVCDEQNTTGQRARGSTFCPSGRDACVRRAPSRTHDAVVGRSRRQSEILECLLDGCSEKEIADRLRITRSTVHTHVKRLHDKLHVHNRGELLAAALRWATLVQP